MTAAAQKGLLLFCVSRAVSDNPIPLITFSFPRTAKYQFLATTIHSSNTFLQILIHGKRIPAVRSVHTPRPGILVFWCFTTVPLPGIRVDMYLLRSCKRVQAWRHSFPGVNTLFGVISHFLLKTKLYLKY